MSVCHICRASTHTHIQVLARTYTHAHIYTYTYTNAGLGEDWVDSGDEQQHGMLSDTWTSRCHPTDIFDAQLVVCLGFRD